ncbi:tetratricopeptide repeat protein, partial [Streptomyces sp. NPDC005407]|uniref:tetratricopeptide repeat protein n=1 Tax=Streptomyces sp. NPDC005407 TaxID=3155340 RepID=UPI0033A9C457
RRPWNWTSGSWWERLLGPDHPDTLTTCSNLANSYSDVGRIQEALELDERVLVGTSPWPGSPRHPHHVQ